MRENAYQAKVIRNLKERFPGCVVLKNDSGYQQGIPDLVILFKRHWACLEVKPDIDAVHQPNQDYWVEHLGNMSYSAFLYPQNEDAVLEELTDLFQPRRAGRRAKI